MAVFLATHKGGMFMGQTANKLRKKNNSKNLANKQANAFMCFNMTQKVKLTKITLRLPDLITPSTLTLPDLWKNEFVFKLDFHEDV